MTLMSSVTNKPFILSVIMPSVIVLSAITLKVVRLNVIMLNVVAPTEHTLGYL
jgi:hypothetical protein